MFSTFGILGIVECNETLKERFNIDYDITKDILIYLDNKTKEFTKNESGYVFNIEQIPGESYAIRLSTIDKKLFGKDKVPYEMYANQFVPL
jgi:anaerobic ribonucleoside-triphosphate reductase